MLHAYRLVYPNSPHAPEMLWEWERLHIDRLLWNAKTFGPEVVQRYFVDWRALAEENRRVWETYYLPRPAYQPWDTWQEWMREYRDLVRDIQNIAEEHNGRLSNNRRPVRREV
jgi:hypothetical protein